MAKEPGSRARAQLEAWVEAQLTLAGWQIQDEQELDLQAALGIAVRQFPLNASFGRADYLLFVQTGPVGAVDLFPENSGSDPGQVEDPWRKYGGGVPIGLEAPVTPLPFLYRASGSRIRFTNGLDPRIHARRIFAFHRPQTLADWVAAEPLPVWLKQLGRSLSFEGDGTWVGGTRVPIEQKKPSSFRSRLDQMPEAAPEAVLACGSEDPKLRALRAIEGSLASRRDRCLVQMTAGSGAALVANALIYRLIKVAGARRVLLLLDGEGSAIAMGHRLEGFAGEDGSPLRELWATELWTSKQGSAPGGRAPLGSSTRVLVSTAETLCALIDPTASTDGGSPDASGPTYRPDLPPETFDAVIWMGSLESSIAGCRCLARYFDAPWVGLVPGPSKSALEFFEHHLLMEYHHHQAVADGLKVDLDLFHPRFTPDRGWQLEQRPVVEGGDWRLRIRAARWQKSDVAMSAKTPGGVARVSPDSTRSFVSFLQNDGFSRLFPGRDHLPKTLIYAAGSDQGRQVAEAIADQLGLDEGFCEYLPQSVDTDASGLVKSFQEHYLPRLAVVDSGAKGLRVPVVELLVVLAPMQDPTEAEQWLGWVGQSVSTAILRAVTPDARAKTHLRVLDLAGMFEGRAQGISSLIQSPSLALEKLLEHLTHGQLDSVLIHTLVGRLVRLAQRMDDEAHASLAHAADGQTLWSMTRALVDALDVDEQLAWAQAHAALKEDDLPDDAEMAVAAQHLIRAAAQPLIENPGLVELLVEYS